MDISLEEIKEIISKFAKAIKEGKPDFAEALAHQANIKINKVQANRDSMGGLLISRAHIS